MGNVLEKSNTAKEYEFPKAKKVNDGDSESRIGSLSLASWSVVDLLSSAFLQDSYNYPFK